MGKDYIDIKLYFSDIKVPSCYPKEIWKGELCVKFLQEIKKISDSCMNNIKGLTNRILRMTKNI